MGKLIFLLFLILQSAFAEDLFPVDEAIKVRVDFWKKVYTEASTEEGFLHDQENLGIIYEKINFEGLSEKEKIKKIKEKKKRWAEVIESIYKEKKVALTSEEIKIVEKIRRFPYKKLREMTKDIRFQLGLSDRYFHGLEESYKYLEEIRTIFKKLSLPEELSYLPHVESSFNYKAYSKVGAVGIWQFMGSTASLYKLKRDYLVDERRDPLLSTQAAARLLADNFKRLKSWPLAITAYNAGANSMARAIIKTGTRNLSEILAIYDTGRFGFASKNFYATFVAAVQISERPQFYFKNIQKRAHPPFQIIKVGSTVKISQLAKSYKLDLNDLENYNLALRPSVFKRDMSIPKGYMLKVPQTAQMEVAELIPSKRKKTGARSIASKKNTQEKVLEKEDQNLYKFKVEPDETLGHYADWSLVPKEKILELNQNFNKNITVGMTVFLPLEGLNKKRFIQKRSEYHAKIQESFFNKFKVDGVSQYEIQKGDTLEKLTGKLEIPLWLIKKYQKKLKLNKLKVGDTLDIPKIVSVSDKSRLAPNQQ